MWIHYNGTLYSLDTGTAIYQTLIENRAYVVIEPVGDRANREIHCKSASEAKRLFHDMYLRLCPQDFH